MNAVLIEPAKPNGPIQTCICCSGPAGSGRTPRAMKAYETCRRQNLNVALIDDGQIVATTVKGVEARFGPTTPETAAEILRGVDVVVYTDTSNRKVRTFVTHGVACLVHADDIKRRKAEATV